MTSQQFQYDFSGTVKVDNNLLYRKDSLYCPLNYFITLKDFECKEHTYAASKYAEVGPLKNKKGRELPIHVCCALFEKEYKRKIAPQLYEAKAECLIKNDPRRNHILFLDYFYNKKYKINWGIKDPLPEKGLGIEYLSEYRHRVFLENIYRQIGILGPTAKNEIATVENLNMDFLLNIKWDITPNVAKAAQTMVLDPTMCRSQIIALTETHLRSDENRFDKIRSMNKNDFIKAKKVVEKKIGIKLDFRKSKDIRKFVIFLPPN